MPTPCDDHEFRDHVVGTLARLDTRTQDILDRVDRQNGNVAALFHKFNQVQLELTAHPMSCPLREVVEGLSEELATGRHPGSLEMRRKIEALEKFNTEDLQVRVDELEKVHLAEVQKRVDVLEKDRLTIRVRRDVSAKWWHAVKPVVTGIAMAIGTLLLLLTLLHNNDVLRFLFRVPTPK